MERRDVKKSVVVSLAMALMMFAGCGEPLPRKGPEPGFSRVGVKLLPTSSFSSSAPAVASEDGVIAVVKHLQDTWNKEDTTGFLATFSEDARIMVGKEERIMSKEEYKGMFPGLFTKYGAIKYKEPKIKLVGNHADVEVVCSIVDNEDVWLIRKMRLIYTNGTWLIEKSTYDVYFKGPGDPRDRPRGRGSEISD